MLAILMIHVTWMHGLMIDDWFHNYGCCLMDAWFGDWYLVQKHGHSLVSLINRKFKKNKRQEIQLNFIIKQLNMRHKLYVIHNNLISVTTDKFHGDLWYPFHLLFHDDMPMMLVFWSTDKKILHLITAIKRWRFVWKSLYDFSL